MKTHADTSRIFIRSNREVKNEIKFYVENSQWNHVTLVQESYYDYICIRLHSLPRGKRVKLRRIEMLEKTKLDRLIP